MKAALVTPFVCHLPLHPGLYLGYGAAVMKQKCELDIIDLNAHVYFNSREGLDKIFCDVDKKQIIFDGFDFYPFYLSLLEKVEEEYRRIPWGDYSSVFITVPSWFVTIPTENILKVSRVIQRESPATAIYFFGNSLDTWTDKTMLAHNGVNIVSLNNLFNTNSGCEPIDYDSLPTPIFENREKYIFDILPFRLKHGCSWGKCRFCSLAKGWNSGYLERSPRHVIRELEASMRTYNPKMLVCRDNAVNGGNLQEFCNRFDGFNTPWAGMARADLNSADITALQKSGCKSLYFGLESGSDRVLRSVNKGLTSKEISDFIKKIHDHGIMPAPSLFVGAPVESDDDFRKTVQFVIDHQPYFRIVNLHPLTMTPQSAFSLAGETPNTRTQERLLELIGICSDVGLKVCVGEQSAEYALYREAFPGPMSCSSPRNSATAFPVS